MLPKRSKVFRTLKRVRWLFILLGLLGHPSASFAINVNSNSVKGFAQAYGFVLAQEYSLERIANKLPDLSVEVELTRSRFRATFPEITSKLEAQLKTAMGEKQFQEVAASLRAKLTNTLESQEITRDLAVQFFDQVKARAKGEIESPVLEYLLALNYMNNPVRELTDGFRQRYQTDGGGKSQGIKLKLQLPRSWVAKEGERPHIVKKWSSENGTGLESILLDIRDAQGMDPTKKEMEEFVRSGEVKDAVPEGSTYVTSGNFNLEMRTGYWIQIAMPLERAGMKMYQELLQYQLYFRGKSIGLICIAGGQENEKQKVNESFERVRPLCQQVLNSLVLLQAY
jgi:hypothetical protein